MLIGLVDASSNSEISQFCRLLNVAYLKKLYKVFLAYLITITVHPEHFTTRNKNFLGTFLTNNLGT